MAIPGIAEPSGIPRWKHLGTRTSLVIAAAAGLIAASVISVPAEASRTSKAMAPAMTHATGALSTLEFVVLHGGYNSDGAGMRDIGKGTLTISGDPATSHVVYAHLVWDLLAPSQLPVYAHGTITINNVTHPVQGTEWASGRSPCWPLNGSARYKNWSYEANVTSAMTANGNGSYLMHLVSGLHNHANPWSVSSPPPLLEGASLIVIYRLMSMPLTVIQVAQGASQAEASTLHSTLNGFTASGGNAWSSKTTYIIADAQKPFYDLGYFDAVQIAKFRGTSPQLGASYPLGDLWDNRTEPVGTLVVAGATNANLKVQATTLPHFGKDCIVWVGQVLSVGGT
jgi:hypothetical protein